ncbi:hypothetical protein AUJ77_01185 [Candidatus Nomurabacteria bacterium CG1_02_43_90]|uniref:Ribosomal RNA small subunit methyltransferase E n=1 Tax=Candidatus Nomurabacteria bacterium CG1_02_43_90 TaxID=1805281 RepID=A0A1J4V4M1_9BACT|nr:MAG: hypothetical protein AUJ77_01185 [Candidatus Nomurabacteria bacterium CG1_02_43_90]
MRLHRFFTEEKIPTSGEFSVTNETLLNQWRNVLRMEVGKSLILFDGTGDEVLCEVVSLTKKSATLKIQEREQGVAPTRKVTLYMTLIKKDNFEMILEKATELGVSRIVPIETSRTEKKGVNYERARKIVREASEQSGRATVPTVCEIVHISDLSGRPGLPESEGLVVFDPRGEKSARAFFTAGDTTPVALLIGPEGGFTDEEMARFYSRNVHVVSMGTQILRAETAAVVALAMVLV